MLVDEPDLEGANEPITWRIGEFHAGRRIVAGLGLNSTRRAEGAAAALARRNSLRSKEALEKYAG